ncbi:hypothetical protein BGW38_003678 [Lunasporangiospora selenospora]|uniref:Arsenate reductase n=1 Tax=Lunasporangiospora selenospora TaxID=979761 RepID=A0A9P6FQU5_9FUNG|nr:hypothetical protein BGW38_003678 [Lunasporangiospora selenospora]
MSPGCKISGQALANLESESGNKQFVVDVQTSPPSESQVEQILGFLLASEEHVSDASADKDERLFYEFMRKNAPRCKTVQEVKTVLKEDPSLMTRPVIVNWEAKKAVIARPPERALDMITSF